MKKSILNIGKALNKVEQKTINGGSHIVMCTADASGCPCDCYIDIDGQCVTDLSRRSEPCQDY
ncbi:hypothetical protein [Tenacibaculum aiptasiae]|uniref:hypothetical protein n=1 Tax=Tenacibaculum aiptasiae TaxID=426481 RepID=UPI00232EB8CA|nr:hypothetical protein [Tenacibaculum aiptasiae]